MQRVCGGCLFGDERCVSAGRASLGSCGSSVGRLGMQRRVRMVMERRTALGSSDEGERSEWCGLAMCTAMSGWAGTPCSAECTWALTAA